MKGSKLINSIYNRKAGNSGFWIGNPSEDAKNIYLEHFGIEKEVLTEEEKHYAALSVLTSEKIGKADMLLAQTLKSDLIWLSPELDFLSWKHPEGKPIFDVLGGRARVSLNDPGVFSETTDVAEVDRFPWPSTEYLDFSSNIEKIKKAEEMDLAVLGGMWCCFFHIACDFFGMEEYFMKMYTDPKVVEAVTDHITDFYLESNKLYFDLVGDKLTSAFFGNDLGSQAACLISPEFFDRFIAPYAKKIIDQMKSYGLKVTIHSCGSIYELIPKLIDLGIDCLHPIQAKAIGMEPDRLAREFGKDIIFMGGVDTQDLLTFGTPQEVKDTVHRLRDIFGENYIVSPSHEALLANVPLENVLAMSEAAND
ncbi:MAG: hypothetical protein LBG82_01200 [Clostridiales Family XIII bacterium]|jgi:uroporphyrinogen decarboxylase|nr:hypothetical protein [Clostridiales Family XIII bacterium]